MKKVVICCLLLISCNGLIATCCDDCKIPESESFCECESTYILENYYTSSHRYLRLSDDSLWELNTRSDGFWNSFVGKDNLSFWLTPDRIEIRRGSNHNYPHILYNKENKETVEARQVIELILFSEKLEAINNTLKEMKASPGK